MVPEHQPRGLDRKQVTAAVSSKADGNMWSENGDGPVSPLADENRREWLRGLGIDYDTQAVRLWVRYGEDKSYKKIQLVSSADAGSSVQADVLVTAEPDVALMVQSADCAIAEIYDPVNKVLALAHLGRHSSEADSAIATVDYLKAEFGTDPGDLQVWIGPAISQEHHTLEWFNSSENPNWEPFVRIENDLIKIDIQGYNRYAFIRAGVHDENIEVSPVDTYSHPEYYSHRESTDLNRELGRIATVAIMLEPAEAA